MRLWNKLSLKLVFIKNTLTGLFQMDLAKIVGTSVYKCFPALVLCAGLPARRAGYRELDPNKKGPRFLFLGPF